MIFFVRHGQGTHNVVQKEWKEGGNSGEPYTTDNDPDFKYRDAELTSIGQQQAADLSERCSATPPELVVVSPMRRATQTAAIAFESLRWKAGMFMAHEAAHEHGGKHTCDKRLSVTELEETFPFVDYSLIESQEDPLWGDGLTRESNLNVSKRGAQLMMWLKDRPEKAIAVVCHSAILCATFNAVLDIAKPEERTWFGTGEMRTMLVSWEFDPESSSKAPKLS